MATYTYVGGPLDSASSYTVGGSTPSNPPGPGDSIDFPSGGSPSGTADVSSISVEGALTLTGDLQTMGATASAPITINAGGDLDDTGGLGTSAAVTAQGGGKLEADGATFDGPTFTVDGSGSSYTDQTNFVAEGPTAVTFSNSADVTTGNAPEDVDTFLGGSFTVTTKATFTAAAIATSDGMNWTFDQGASITLNGGGNLAAGGAVGADLNGTGLIDDATIDSAGGWAIGGSGLGIGATGVATFQNGADVTAASLYLGDFQGDNGKLTVSGEGTSLTVAGDTSIAASAGLLLVGNSGTGSLTINQGASVTDTITSTLANSTVGYDTNSNGTVLVDGDKSNWTTSGTLDVGGSGFGQVTVQNMASMSADQLDIAEQQGSGTAAAPDIVTVTGDGSSLTVKGALNVGEAGVGELDADTKGSVSVTGSVDSMLVAGDQATGDGTVFITDEGTSLSVNGLAVIGQSGAGDMTVQNAAQATIQQNFTAGNKKGSTGNDLFTGAKTAVTIGGDYQVGVDGDHDETIDQGASVAVTGGMSLGVNETGTATMLVSDADSELQTGNGDVTIADAGIASMTVQDGATFDASTNDVTVGGMETGDGTLQLTGTDGTTDEGASMTASTITIGGDGHGTLVVSDGADLSVLGEMKVGDGATGFGTATITDTTANLDVGGGLTVGGDGTGRVLINGADVSVTSGDITVGDSTTGDGILTINTATLDFDGELKIGESGSGTVIAQLGAALSPGTITIGDKAGSVGELDVDGSGTSITSDDLTVGSAGQGTLKITNGAMLTTNGDAAVGDLASTDTQTVLADTGGVWDINGSLTFGGSALVSVTIQGGASVDSSADVVMGDMATGGGTITVSGAVASKAGTMVSNLEFGKTLTIGNQGSAALSVSAGGVVGPIPNTIGPVDVELGAMAKSSGTATVDGAGSLLEGSSLAVGGTGGAAGGVGSLTLSNGGAALFSADAIVWNAGSVVLTGGTLDAVAVSIATGGSVSGDGTIGAAVSNAGMVTATGGELSISGAVSGTGSLAIAASATLDIEGAFTSGTASFGGSGATLDLGTPLATSGAIANFASGELIFLAGVQDSSYQYSGDTLAIIGVGGTVDLDVGPGYSQGEFTVVAVAGGTDVTVSAPPCFVTGTMILTENGPVPVEQLRAGDRIVTASEASGATSGCVSRPVVWVGHRRVDCRAHPRPDDVIPIRVRAGAFGPGLPARDLRLSPDHAVFLNGVLIPIRYLVNDSTIGRVPMGEVTYWHVELSQHDILLAEGLPAESYLDTGNRDAFANHTGPVRLHPDFAAHTREAFGCAPLVVTGAVLEEVKRDLSARAKHYRGGGRRAAR